LGPFDIHYVMMVLSGHNVVPREGHFKTMLWVYGYLQRYAKGRILVNDTPMDLSQYPAVITPLGISSIQML
jgi:hypothetical protein